MQQPPVVLLPFQEIHQKRRLSGDMQFKWLSIAQFLVLLFGPYIFWPTLVLGWLKWSYIGFLIVSQSIICTIKTCYITFHMLEATDGHWEQMCLLTRRLMMNAKLESWRHFCTTCAQANKVEKLADGLTLSKGIKIVFFNHSTTTWGARRSTHMGNTTFDLIWGDCTVDKPSHNQIC